MHATEDLSSHRPLPWRSDDVAFECAPLGGTLSPAFMSRHFLVLGETGAGKTRSVVEPLAASCAAYRAKELAHRAAMLAIDPKFELGDVLTGILGDQASERLVSLSPRDRRYRLDYFEGVDRPALSGNGVLDRLRDFAPEFGRSLNAGGDNVMWSKRAEGFVATLLDIDLGIRRRMQDGESDFWHQLRDALSAAVLGEPGMADTPSAAVLTGIVRDLAAGRIGYFRDNYFDGLQALVAAAMRLSRERYGDADVSSQDLFWRCCIDVARSAGLDPQRYQSLEEFRGLYPEAYISILSLANALLSDLSSADFSDHVSLNPFEPPSNAFSVLAAIEAGRILLYTPDTADISAINVGKALKSKFFEFTFRRCNKQRPVVYVCDEFQHFITGDAVSGEQSFLDRCRAYRAVCVLASQSLNALRLRLRHLDPQGPADDALNSLVNNAGNKYFFRNTDIDTVRRVRQLLPDPPLLGRPHVADVRPLSTLDIGECYYLLSNGRWGRRQIVVPGTQ